MIISYTAASNIIRKYRGFHIAQNLVASVKMYICKAHYAFHTSWWVITKILRVILFRNFHNKYV